MSASLSGQQLAEIRARAAAVASCPDARANGREDGLHTWAGFAGSHLRCFLCRATVATDQWVRDSTALVAEVERLKAERSDRADDLAAALGRSGLDWSELVDVATGAMRRAELLGSASLAVHHCVNLTHPKWIADRTDRRGCPWCRLAELERMQQPVGRTVFLADYDGADAGPTLFASLEAAQAWVAEWSAGDGPWDWFEQDGVWEQWTCDRDSDRPTSKGAGTVTPLELGAVASVVWRAEYPEGALTLGHYTGQDAAMAHVHQVLADEENTTVEAIGLRVMWRADDPHGPEGEPTAWECWLSDEDGGDDLPTGYVVTPIEVEAAYDPDGGE